MTASLSLYLVIDIWNDRSERRSKATYGWDRASLANKGSSWLFETRTRIIKNNICACKTTFPSACRRSCEDKCKLKSFYRRALIIITLIYGVHYFPLQVHEVAWWHIKVCRGLVTRRSCSGEAAWDHLTSLCRSCIQSPYRLWDINGIMNTGAESRFGVPLRPISSGAQRVLFLLIASLKRVEAANWKYAT